MHEDHEGGPIATVTTMDAHARSLATAIAAIQSPSEITELIRAMTGLQGRLADVYSKLASWHGLPEHRMDYPGEAPLSEPESSEWVRAEVGLEEAAQYSLDSAAALERARRANMSATWFEEIRADEV